MTGISGTSDFRYVNGALHAEGVPLARLAAEIGTPFYCYSAATLRRRYMAFVEAFAGLPVTVCYALKANSNLAVVRTLAALGAGADVVSEGELRRALAAGVPAERIVFSGVGKTRAELDFAVACGIRQINVESEAELSALSEVAAASGRTATITLRVNPDVDARSHDKISTGRRKDKFGIDVARAPALFARAEALPGLRPVGLSIHIGSQITDLEPFRAAFERIARLARELRAAGHRVERLDLGGGLGIAYGDETPPGVGAYARVVAETVAPLGCELTIEPGRAIAGPAGVLVTRVIHVKRRDGHVFVVVDAAMNDLKRPALYDAYHAIVPVAEPAADARRAPVDVVGPVCESGDTFASARPLPPVAADDLLAICTAGAYGAVMASSYNSRPLVPEVLVDGTRFAVVRRRPSFDEMLAQDTIPEWLSGPAEAPDAETAPPASRASSRGAA